MRKYKNKQKFSQGFTLVEVLVSITLLALIAIAFMPIFSTYLKNIITAGNLTKDRYRSISTIERVFGNSGHSGGYVVSSQNMKVTLNAPNNKTISTKSAEGNGELKSVQGYNILGDPGKPANSLVSFYADSVETNIALFPNTITDDFITKDIRLYATGMRLDDPQALELYYTDRDGSLKRVDGNWYNVSYGNKLWSGDSSMLVITVYGGGPISFSTSPLYICYHDHTIKSNTDPGTAFKVEVTAPQTIMVGDKNEDGNYYYYVTSQDDNNGDGFMDILARPMDPTGNHKELNLKSAMNDVKWISKHSGDGLNTDRQGLNPYGYFIMGGDLGQIRRFWREENGNYFWGGDYSDGYNFDSNKNSSGSQMSNTPSDTLAVNSHSDVVALSKEKAQSPEFLQVQPYSYSYIASPYDSSGNLLKNGIKISEDGDKYALYSNTMFTINAIKNRSLGFYTAGDVIYDNASGLYKPNDKTQGINYVAADKNMKYAPIDDRYGDAPDNLQKYITITSVDTVSVQRGETHTENHSLDKSYNLYLGYIPAVIDIWDNTYTGGNSKTYESGIRPFTNDNPDMNGFKTTMPWRMTLGVGTNENFSKNAHFSYGSTLFEPDIFNTELYTQHEKHKFYIDLYNKIDNLKNEMTRDGYGIFVYAGDPWYGIPHTWDGKNDTEYEELLLPFLNRDTDGNNIIDRNDNAVDFEGKSLGLSEYYRKHHSLGKAARANHGLYCEVWDDMTVKANNGTLSNEFRFNKWNGGFLVKYDKNNPNNMKSYSEQMYRYWEMLNSIQDRCRNEIANSESGYNKYNDTLANTTTSLKIAWNYSNTSSSDYRLTGMCGPSNFKDIHKDYANYPHHSNEKTIEVLNKGDQNSSATVLETNKKAKQAEAAKYRADAAKNKKLAEDYKQGKITELDAKKAAAYAIALDTFEKNTGYKLELDNNNYIPSDTYGNSSFYNTTVKAIYETALADADTRLKNETESENERFNKLVNPENGTITEEFKAKLEAAKNAFETEKVDANSKYNNKLLENQQILEKTKSETEDYKGYYGDCKKAKELINKNYQDKLNEIDATLSNDINAENTRYNDAITAAGLQAQLDNYNNVKAKYQANYDFYKANRQYYEDLLARIDAGVSVHSKTKTSPDENLSDKDEIKIDDAHNVDGTGKDLGLKQYFEENHITKKVAKDDNPMDDYWDRIGFGFEKTKITVWKSCEKIKDDAYVIKEKRNIMLFIPIKQEEIIGYNEKTEAMPDMKTYRDMVQAALDSIKADYDAYMENEKSVVKSPADFETAKLILEAEHNKIINDLNQKAINDKALAEANKNQSLNIADSTLTQNLNQADKDKTAADEAAKNTLTQDIEKANENKTKAEKKAEIEKAEEINKQDAIHLEKIKSINNEKQNAVSAAESERKNRFAAEKKKYKESCENTANITNISQLDINKHYENLLAEAVLLERKAEILDDMVKQFSTNASTGNLYDAGLAQKLLAGYQYNPLYQPVGQKNVQKQNETQVSLAYMSIPGAFGEMRNSSTLHNQQVTDPGIWTGNYTKYDRENVRMFTLNRSTTFLDSDSITVDEGTENQRSFSLAVGYVVSGVQYTQYDGTKNNTTVPTIMNNGVVYIRSGDKENNHNNINHDNAYNFDYGTGYELKIEKNTFHEFFTSNTYTMEKSLRDDGSNYDSGNSLDQFASAGYWRDILHPLYYSIYGEKFTPDKDGKFSYWPYYYEPTNSYITGHILYDKKINCVKWGRTWANGYSAMWGATDGTVMSWGENYDRYMNGTYREKYPDDTAADAKYGSGAVMAEFQNWKRVRDAFNTKNSNRIKKENSQIYYHWLEKNENGYLQNTFVPISFNIVGISARKIYAIPATWKQMCDFATSGSKYMSFGQQRLHNGTHSRIIENSYLDKCSLILNEYAGKSLDDYGFVSPLNSITDIESDKMNTWVAVGTQAYGKENPFDISEKDHYLTDPLNMTGKSNIFSTSGFNTSENFASKKNNTINKGGRGSSYSGSYVNVRSWLDLSAGKDHGPVAEAQSSLSKNNFFFRWQAVKFTDTLGVNIVGVTYANNTWFIMGYIDKNANGIQDKDDLAVAYYTNDPTKSCHEDGGWTMVKTSYQKSNDHTEAVVVYGKHNITHKKIASINALATQSD